MKQIGCKDLGAVNCDFVASGETADDVKTRLFEHATAEHADKLAAMSDQEKAEISHKMDEMLAAQ